MKKRMILTMLNIRFNSGDAKIAEILIDEGAEIRYRNNDGQTARDLANVYGKVNNKIVFYLIFTEND